MAAGDFGAGVVVGDDGAVGKAGRQFAHHRALAPVAVAAAAEHHDQLPLRMGAECPQHRFQRVGGVGVIDVDGSAGGMVGDQFQPAMDAAELFERRRGVVGIGAGADHQAQRAERVHALEAARQRQVDIVDPPEHFQLQALAVGQGQQISQDKFLRLGAIADQAMTTPGAQL